MIKTINNNRKIIGFCLTILMTFFSFQSIVFADDSVEAISGSVKKIVGAVAFIGYACAMIMLIYVGIKYTMASANEKADVKQGLISYLIGAFLIFGASTVAGIAAGIMSGTDGTETLAGKIIDSAISSTKTGTK